MAGMCGNCQAKKEEYEKLAEQLRDAIEKAKIARDDAIKIQNDFSNVIINGKPIGSDELDNCINNFSLTTSSLRTAYQQCLVKINSIVCTHLKEDDNTIAGTYYR